MEEARLQMYVLLAFLAGLFIAGGWGLWRAAALARRLRDLHAANAALRARLEAEREKSEWLHGAKGELADAFLALSNRSLEDNSKKLVERARELLGQIDGQLSGRLGTHKAELSGLLTPLKENLHKLEEQVRQLEGKRESAYGALAQQLRSLAEEQRGLQAATTTLGEALKSSSARGQWGEMQLVRVAELAGMSEHVDFALQQHTSQGRPDMVVHLPGGGVLPVDAKTPLAAYLQALRADGEEERKRKLAEHARQLRARAKELASKDYSRAFERSPDFVVLFVPSEAALAAAFSADPDLLDEALQMKVLPASPVTLLALLKSAAYGWRQQTLSDNARELAKEGRLLIERFENYSASLAEVGRSLQKSVEAYNRAVGSYQSRLTPVARRFKEKLAAGEFEAAPERLEATPRKVAENPESGEK